MWSSLAPSSHRIYNEIGFQTEVKDPMSRVTPRIGRVSVSGNGPGILNLLEDASDASKALNGPNETYFDTLLVWVGRKIVRKVLRLYDYGEEEDQMTPALLLLKVGGRLAEAAAMEFGCWKECSVPWRRRIKRKSRLLLRIGAFGDIKAAELGRLMGDRLQTMQFEHGVSIRHAHFLIAYGHGVRKLEIDARLHLDDSADLAATIRACPQLTWLNLIVDSGYMQDTSSALASCVGRVDIFKIKIVVYYGLMFPMQEIWNAVTSDASSTQYVEVDVIPRVGDPGCIWKKLRTDVLRAPRKNEVRVLVLLNSLLSNVHQCYRNDNGICICDH